MQIMKYVFQQHGDERGQLVALEEFNDIPFEIKRVYYMYDTKEGVRRGFHAHKKLKQILICIHGSCKILLDNGDEKKNIRFRTCGIGFDCSPLRCGHMGGRHAFPYERTCGCKR